jgi:Bacterial extracellular solute-binding protein, family 7
LAPPAASEGRLEIRVHSAGSLFPHPEIKNAVRSNQVPIGEFLLSRLANQNPIFEADAVPFLATDYDRAEQLWALSRPEIERLLASEGLIVLYSVPWPPQGLYADRPIEGLADLRGLRFRAYNTATERLAQLAGALPTQIGTLAGSGTLGLLIPPSIILIVYGVATEESIARCFLDGISMVVLTTAVVMPLVQSAGFDPISFGVYWSWWSRWRRSRRRWASTCSSCRA